MLPKMMRYRAGLLDKCGQKIDVLAAPAAEHLILGEQATAVFEGSPTSVGSSSSRGSFFPL
jgi:hypothetical protein